MPESITLFARSAASLAFFSSRDPITTGTPARAHRTASPNPRSPVPPITAILFSVTITHSAFQAVILSEAKDLLFVTPPESGIRNLATRPASTNN
jgi:hypothetical protein